MAKNPNFNKRASNNKKTEKKPVVRNSKPKFTKVNVEIAASDFYVNSIDSLYNLLNSISFNKVAIPVKMAKSEVFNNPQLKGTVTIGTIDKFTNDNRFTVTLTEENANCITTEHVMSIRCKKDWGTDEITYVSEFRVVKGESINAQYKDIEKAFTDAEEESVDTEETTDETVEETTEESNE